MFKSRGFLLFILAFLSLPLAGQKKVKQYSISEVKKGDLSSKVFKDYPESQSRILFDMGHIDFIHEVDTFRIEKRRHVRVKFINDSVLSAHVLGLTSFDHESLINLTHYSLVNGEIKSAEKKSIWATINKYKPLSPQINEMKEGDILEFIFKEELESMEDIPSWQFEYEIPVDYSEWKAEIPAIFTYKPVFKGYVPLYINSSELLKDENKSWVEIDGFFIYQNHYACKDVAPFKKVIYSPSSKNYLTAVSFYLDNVEPYRSYKKVKGQTWEQVSNQLYYDAKLGNRISEFDASQIISQLNLDTLVENQIADVYAWVKNSISWNGDIGIYAENDLSQVIASGSGSIAEINILLSALIKELGIPSNPVLLRTSDQGEVNMELPSASQFNYVITWLDFKGTHFLLDASDPCLEIGLLRPICLNNKGLKVTRNFEDWADLEDGKAAKIKIVTQSIVQDNKLMASVNVTKTDQFAFQDCKNFEDIYELLDVEKGVSIFEEEMTMSDSTFVGSRIRFKCDADSLVSKSGSSWSYSPFWFEQIKSSPFVDEERKYPIVFPFLFEYNWSYSLNYHNDVSVSSVPKRKEASLPDNSMRFIYEVKELDGILQVNAQFSILKRRFDPSVYEDIIKFYDEVYKMFNEEVKIKVKS